MVKYNACDRLRQVQPLLIILSSLITGCQKQPVHHIGVIGSLPDERNAADRICYVVEYTPSRSSSFAILWRAQFVGHVQTNEYGAVTSINGRHVGLPNVSGIYLLTKEHTIERAIIDEKRTESILAYLSSPDVVNGSNNAWLEDIYPMIHEVHQ